MHLEFFNSFLHNHYLIALITDRYTLNNAWILLCCYGEEVILQVEIALFHTRVSYLTKLCPNSVLLLKQEWPVCSPRKEHSTCLGTLRSVESAHVFSLADVSSWFTHAPVH
jgi:hypothetical protein